MEWVVSCDVLKKPESGLQYYIYCLLKVKECGIRFDKLCSREYVCAVMGLEDANNSVGTQALDPEIRVTETGEVISENPLRIEFSEDVGSDTALQRSAFFCQIEDALREEPKFELGQKCVFPSEGLAEVIDIEEKDIAGTFWRFYVLRVLATDRKFMVPIRNANSLGLRPVISEQEIKKIFDILRDEGLFTFDNQTWNLRYRGFMDKIKTGSIFDVAKVLRALYRLKADKQLSFGERRMLDMARSLILKEVAISRGQTEEEVKKAIEAIFAPA